MYKMIASDKLKIDIWHIYEVIVEKQPRRCRLFAKLLLSFRLLGYPGR